MIGKGLRLHDCISLFLQSKGYALISYKSDFLIKAIGAALLVFTLSAGTAFSQNEVAGTVTDASSGETLPGVNVIVQGTTTGTSTDGEGIFSLDVPSLQDTLVFSFVGYQTSIVPIDGRTEINVAMEIQAVAGEELVVVGYGTQERRQITGSVSSVGEEEFVKGSVNNAAEMIQGKVPGLTISSAGGATRTVILR